METNNSKFIVLSPDGIPISPDETYSSILFAYAAAKEWGKRYEFQGYYSSAKYGRIPLEDIISYCEVVEI